MPIVKQLQLPWSCVSDVQVKTRGSWTLGHDLGTNYCNGHHTAHESYARTKPAVSNDTCLKKLHRRDKDSSYWAHHHIRHNVLLTWGESRILQDSLHNYQWLTSPSIGAAILELMEQHTVFQLFTLSWDSSTCN